MAVREDKVAAVAELTEQFRNSQATVLTEYRGLTVAELKELRRALGSGTAYTVTKNTLARRAAAEAGIDGLAELFTGPTALAFVAGDPVEAAKGLPFFLGAAARIIREYPECEFLISGGGPEEHNLRRLARSLGLSGAVTFVSNLYDFTTSIDAMDIFCLPSLQQGLGVTMLEAMARGKPVIATGVGGVHSIVKDGRTGLVVPPSDSERLAARILELLRDPPLARRIGAAGRAVVREQFRVDRMVRETADLYREIVPAGVAVA